MTFNPLEFNQILGHSTEVAKIKKKQLDKKTLEEIEEEKKLTQGDDKVFIQTVQNKDPEIGLKKNGIPDSPESTHEKKNAQLAEKKRTFKESYKGNFLDISE